MDKEALDYFKPLHEKVVKMGAEVKFEALVFLQ